jgi:hypothetical protein
MRRLVSFVVVTRVSRSWCVDLAGSGGRRSVRVVFAPSTQHPGIVSSVITTQRQGRLAGWVAAVVVADVAAALVLAASRNWSAGATLAAALVAGALVLAGSAVPIKLAVVMGPSMPMPRVVAIVRALIQVIFTVLVILIGGIAVGLSQWDVPF